MLKILKNFIKYKFPVSFYHKKSFSQCGEDIIILDIFTKKSIDKIRYLDIGANHPYRLSNTALFYLKNNTKNYGIIVEPNPSLFKLLSHSRPNDIVLNVGISASQNEECLNFYLIEPDVLSTFSKNEAVEYEKLGHKIKDTIQVRCININSIFEHYFNDKEIDFLNVDIEGFDYEVIGSIDFTKYRPKVICVETVKYRNEFELQRDYEIIGLLESNGYVSYAQNFVNTIFVENTYLNKVV